MFRIKEGNGEKRRKKRSDCLKIDDQFPRHLPLIHPNSLPFTPYYLLPDVTPLAPPYLSSSHCPALSPGPLVPPPPFTLPIALFIPSSSFALTPLLSPFPPSPLRLTLSFTSYFYPFASTHCYYPLARPLYFYPLL